MLFIAFLAAATSMVPKPDNSLPNAGYVGTKFVGGDWDGLSVGWKVDRDGKTYVGLLPSKKDASPPPLEIAKIVNGLIDAYNRGDVESYSIYLSPSAFSTLNDPYCTTGEPFISREFFLDKKMKWEHNSLYSYDSYHKKTGNYSVRIEWLSGGQLKGFSDVEIVGNMVQSVCSRSERLPPLPPLPPRAN